MGAARAPPHEPRGSPVAAAPAGAPAPPPTPAAAGRRRRLPPGSPPSPSPGHADVLTGLPPPTRPAATARSRALPERATAPPAPSAGPPRAGSSAPPGPRAREPSGAGAPAAPRPAPRGRATAARPAPLLGAGLPRFGRSPVSRRDRPAPGRRRRACVPSARSRRTRWSSAPRVPPSRSAASWRAGSSAIPDSTQIPRRSSRSGNSRTSARRRATSRRRSHRVGARAPPTASAGARATAGGHATTNGIARTTPARTPPARTRPSASWGRPPATPARITRRSSSGPVEQPQERGGPADASGEPDRQGSGGGSVGPRTRAGGRARTAIAAQSSAASHIATGLSSRLTGRGAALTAPPCRCAGSRAARRRRGSSRRREGQAQGPEPRILTRVPGAAISAIAPPATGSAATSQAVMRACAVEPRSSRSSWARSSIRPERSARALARFPPVRRWTRMAVTMIRRSWAGRRAARPSSAPSSRPPRASSPTARSSSAPMGSGASRAARASACRRERPAWIAAASCCATPGSWRSTRARWRRSADRTREIAPTTTAAAPTRQATGVRAAASPRPAAQAARAATTATKASGPRGMPARSSCAPRRRPSGTP